MARDRDPKPNGKAKLEQEIQIDIVASEAIMKPSVSINGVPADEVTGNVRNWRAKRMMTEFDVDGDVTFEITFQDTSGEVGAMVSATTDGSAVQYCIEGCADGDSTLAGDWLLDGDGAAGVGPSAGSTEWWASVEADRPCWMTTCIGLVRTVHSSISWVMKRLLKPGRVGQTVVQRQWRHMMAALSEIMFTMKMRAR